MFYAVLPADPVEEHLPFARSEAGGEHLAVVGEDLVGDAVAAHGQRQSFTDRAGRGPRHKERGDAEAGVVVESGDHLELGPALQLHPAHDVHLPEFHGAGAFPAAIVLPLASSLLRVHQAMTDQEAIDGGAPGKRDHTLAIELMAQRSRAPAGMGFPKLEDAGLGLRGHLVRAPGRA